LEIEWVILNLHPKYIAGWSSGSPEKRQIFDLTGFSRMLENQSKQSLLIFGTRWVHIRRLADEGSKSSFKNILRGGAVVVPKNRKFSIC
jgi:hypothetical protein